MRHIFELCWIQFWDVCTEVTNNSEFLACLSVYWLAYFFTEIRPKHVYLHYCMIYLSEFLWKHSLDVCIQFPNDSEFLVHLSVCGLAIFLMELGQYRVISSSGWNFFLKFLSNMSGIFLLLFQLFLNFLYVSQSIIVPTYFWN